MVINSYEDFTKQLGKVCRERHGINIFTEQRQINENLELLQRISAESGNSILVKNTRELYQDFLTSTVLAEKYLARIADEFKYLTDFSKNEELLEEEKEL